MNDCKSHADALLSAGAGASKASEEKRLAIEMSMIKQHLAQRETRFQWVEGSMMPADELTKGRVSIGSSRRLRCWKNDELFENASRWDMMDLVQQFCACVKVWLDFTSVFSAHLVLCKVDTRRTVASRFVFSLSSFFCLHVPVDHTQVLQVCW